MFGLALVSLITAAPSTGSLISVDERVDRFCAYVVGIPYASDNFNQDEWERFQVCRNVIEVDDSQIM
jgi:hypothetical protein